MTSTTPRAREIEALRCLLDSHGADRTRWPARERLRFAHLISQDSQARALLAEAAAFDRLLDRAPVVPQARESALAERIVATAVAAGRPASVPSSRHQEAGDNVLDLAAARLRSAAARRSGVLRRNGWSGMAALLAASLVLGVLVGASGVMPGDRTVVEDIDGGQLALSDDATPAEGDLL